jgi:hypothetical protein
VAEATGKGRDFDYGEGLEVAGQGGSMIVVVWMVLMVLLSFRLTF